MYRPSLCIQEYCHSVIQVRFEKEFFWKRRKQTIDPFKFNP